MELGLQCFLFKLKERREIEKAKHNIIKQTKLNISYMNLSYMKTIFKQNKYSFTIVFQTGSNDNILYIKQTVKKKIKQIDAIEFIEIFLYCQQ